MSKKRKHRRVKPDEVYTKGPISIARFGSNLLFQSDWPETAFAEFQNWAIEKYPNLIREIDGVVAEIAQLVSELPPKLLLHRAWCEMASRHARIKSEVEIGMEEAISVRMLDYVQSVIAAVPPRPNQRHNITEEEWQTLKTKIEELFQKINHDYQICTTAKNRIDDLYFNEDFEKFKFKAQIYWCNIRGNRYQVHEPAYLADMFLPHSDVLEELFGISGKQFVDEITHIWYSLSFGFRDAFADFDEFRDDTLNALQHKLEIHRPSSDKELADLMAEVVKEHEWEQRQRDVFGRVIGTDLFDLEKTTSLPQVLLDELTWFPGEEKEFFTPGEYCGWPLRIWPVFKRPFIRLDGHYYCFDLYSLLDNLYRVMQRIILRLKPEYQNTWRLVQQNISESLPIKYLQEILPGALVWQSVYYRWKTDSGNVEWCEADALLLYDDHLFVIECRGEAFTYTSPATDFPAYVASLRNLVLKPVTQGNRFVEFLSDSDKVQIFDRDHNRIAEIGRADFRHITICAVTIDPFTELAAQVQHLRKIGVDVGAHPVWAISVDDLRVYADIFENPLIFLHFVEQRMRAHYSDIIQSDDELDHLGLYLKHNHYSQYAKTMKGKSDARIGFIGYRSDIDNFFRERMFDAETPCPLKQDTPNRLLEIVECLTATGKQGRANICSYLLDLNGDWRVHLSQSIDEELKRQPTTLRPKPLSTHGEVKLTVFCWTESYVPRDATGALAHTQTVLLLNEEDKRILLELSYTDRGMLQDVSWHWVDKAGISPLQLPGLRADAERLRQARIAQVKATQRKIGRNESCPCGSGKKYKKCCLGR